MITVTLSPCLCADKPFAAVTTETVAFVGAEVSDGLKAALFDGSGTCVAIGDVAEGKVELDLDTQEAVDATDPVGPGEAVSVWLVVGDKDTHIATVPCLLIRNLIDDEATHPHVPADRYPTVAELEAWLEAAGTVREAVCTCAKAAASSASAAASSARLASAKALDAVNAVNAASASAKSAAQSAAQAAEDGVAAAKSAQAAQASESAAGQSAEQAAAQASGAARSATQANASAQAAASSATAASQSAAQAGRALADAQTARGDAQAARDAAKASETAAAGSAKAAAASATQAAGSKAAAAGSASSAAASATQAQEAKAGAETAKSGAEAAKSGAETARDAAAQSATQAAQSADEAEAAKASLEEALAWSGKMRFRESCLRSLGYANGVAALQERDAKSDREQQFLHGDGQCYLFQGSGKFYLLDKELKLVKDLTGLATPFYPHEGMACFPYFVVRDGRLIEQIWTGATIHVYDIETKGEIARLSTGYNSRSALLYNDRTGHLLVHKPSAAAGTVVTAMDIRDADLNVIGEMEAPEAIAPLCDQNGWPAHFAQYINGRTYVAFNKRADASGTPLYVLDENDVPQPVVDSDGEPIMMYADRTIDNTSGYYACWYPGFYTDDYTFVGADGTKKTKWMMTDGVMNWIGDAEDETGAIVWRKNLTTKIGIDALNKRYKRPTLCSGSGGDHPNGVRLFPQIVLNYDPVVYCFSDRSGYGAFSIVHYVRNGGSTVPVPGSKLTVINTSGYETTHPVYVYC